MIADMNALLVDNRLTGASRTLLLNWLAGNTTGDERLRAGFPKGWRIGDKTGTGAHGTTNDIAIVWRSPERPLLVAAYLTEDGRRRSDLRSRLGGDRSHCRGVGS